MVHSFLEPTVGDGIIFVRMQLSHLTLFCVCVLLDPICRCGRTEESSTKVKNVGKSCIISTVCSVANFVTSAQCVEETHISDNSTAIKLKLGEDCSVTWNTEEQPLQIGWFIDTPKLKWISKCWSKKKCSFVIPNVDKNVLRVGALLSRAKHEIPLAVISSCPLSVSSDTGSLIQQVKGVCKDGADIVPRIPSKKEKAGNGLRWAVPTTLYSKFKRHWMSARRNSTLPTGSAMPNLVKEEDREVEDKDNKEISTRNEMPPTKDQQNYTGTISIIKVELVLPENQPSENHSHEKNTVNHTTSTSERAEEQDTARKSQLTETTKHEMHMILLPALSSEFAEDKNLSRHISAIGKQKRQTPFYGIRKRETAPFKKQLNRKQKKRAARKSGPDLPDGAEKEDTMRQSLPPQEQGKENGDTHQPSFHPDQAPGQDPTHNNQQKRKKRHFLSHIREKRRDRYGDEVLRDVIPNIYLSSDTDVKDVIFGEEDDSSDMFTGELNPNDKIWTANELPNNYEPIMSFPDDYFQSTVSESGVNTPVESKKLNKISRIQPFKVMTEFSPSGNILPMKTVKKEMNEKKHVDPDALQGKDMLEALEEDIDEKLRSSMDSLMQDRVAQEKEESSLVASLAMENKMKNALSSMEKGSVSGEGVNYILYPTDDDDNEFEAAAIGAINSFSLSTPPSPSPSTTPARPQRKRVLAQVLPAPPPNLDRNNKLRLTQPEHPERKKSNLEILLRKKLENVNLVNKIQVNLNATLSNATVLLPLNQTIVPSANDFGGNQDSSTATFYSRLHESKTSGFTPSDSLFATESEPDALDKTIERNMLKSEALYIGSFNSLKTDVRHSLAIYVHDRVAQLLFKNLMDKVYQATHPIAWAMVKQVCARPLAQLRLIGTSWMGWSPWSSCSVTCGTEGFHVRRRECKSSQICTGTNFDIKTCTQQEYCVGSALWLDWSSWSMCFNNCGQTGRMLRFRSCLTSDSAVPCSGDYSEAMACVPTACPKAPAKEKKKGKKEKKKKKKGKGKPSKEQPAAPAVTIAPLVTSVPIITTAPSVTTAAPPNVTTTIAATTATSVRQGLKHRRHYDDWINKGDTRSRKRKGPHSRSAPSLGALGMKDLSDTMNEIETEYQQLRQDNFRKPDEQKDPFLPLSNGQYVANDKYPNGVPPSDELRARTSSNEALMKETSIETQQLNEEKAVAIVDAGQDKMELGLQHVPFTNTKQATVLTKEELTWTVWGLWSQCSVTCGRGLQFRHRDCMQLTGDSIEGLPAKSTWCPGFEKERKFCSNGVCLLSVAIPRNLVGIEQNGDGIIRCKHNIKEDNLAGIYWITPIGQRITADSLPDHYSMQNMTLIVHNAKRSDLGQYMCVLLGPNQLFVPTDWESFQQGVRWNAPSHKPIGDTGSLTQNGGSEKPKEPNIEMRRPNLRVMAVILLVLTAILFFVSCAMCCSARLSAHRTRDDSVPMIATRRKSEDQWHTMKKMSNKAQDNSHKSQTSPPQPKGKLNRLRKSLGDLFGENDYKSDASFGIGTSLDKDDDNNQNDVVGGNGLYQMSAAEYDNFRLANPSQLERDVARLLDDTSHNASPPPMERAFLQMNENHPPPSMEVSRSIMYDGDHFEIITSNGREHQVDRRFRKIRATLPRGTGSFQDCVKPPHICHNRSRKLPHLNYSHPHLSARKTSCRSTSKWNRGFSSGRSLASSGGFEVDQDESDYSTEGSSLQTRPFSDTNVQGKDCQSFDSYESRQSTSGSRSRDIARSETQQQKRGGNDSHEAGQESPSNSQTSPKGSSSFTQNTFDKFGQRVQASFEQYAVHHPDEPYPYRETRSRRHSREDGVRVNNMPGNMQNGSNSMFSSSQSGSNAVDQSQWFLSSHANLKQQKRNQSPSPPLHHNLQSPAKAFSPLRDRTFSSPMSQTRSQDSPPGLDTSNSPLRHHQRVVSSPVHLKHLEGGGEGSSSAVRNDGRKSARDVLLRKAMENSFIQATSSHGTGHSSCSSPEQRDNRGRKLLEEGQHSYPAAPNTRPSPLTDRPKSNSLDNFSFATTSVDHAQGLSSSDLNWLEQKDKAGGMNISDLNCFEYWKEDSSAQQTASRSPVKSPPKSTSLYTHSASALPNWPYSGSNSIFPSPTRSRSPTVRKTRFKSSLSTPASIPDSPERQVEVCLSQETNTPGHTNNVERSYVSETFHHTGPPGSPTSPDYQSHKPWDSRCSDGHEESGSWTEKQCKSEYQEEWRLSCICTEQQMSRVQSDELNRVKLHKKSFEDSSGSLTTSSGTTEDSSSVSKSSLKSAIKRQSRDELRSGGGQLSRRVSFSDAKIINNAKGINSKNFPRDSVSHTSDSRDSKNSSSGGDLFGSSKSESSENQFGDRDVNTKKKAQRNFPQLLMHSSSQQRDTVSKSTHHHDQKRTESLSNHSHDHEPVGCPSEHFDQVGHKSSGALDLDRQSILSSHSKQTYILSSEKERDHIPLLMSGVECQVRESSKSHIATSHGLRSGKKESDIFVLESQPFVTTSEFNVGSCESFDSLSWSPAYTRESEDSYKVDCLLPIDGQSSRTQTKKDSTTYCKYMDVNSSERSQGQGQSKVDPPLLVDLRIPEDSRSVGLATLSSHSLRQKLHLPLTPSIAFPSKKHHHSYHPHHQSLGSKESLSISQSSTSHQLTTPCGSISAAVSTSDGNSSDCPYIGVFENYNPHGSVVPSDSSELVDFSQHSVTGMTFDSFHEMLTKRTPGAFFKPITKEDSSASSHY